MLQDAKTAFFIVLDIGGRVFASASLFSFLTNIGLPDILPILAAVVILTAIILKRTQGSRAFARAIREDRALTRQYYGQ